MGQNSASFSVIGYGRKIDTYTKEVHGDCSKHAQNRQLGSVSAYLSEKEGGQAQEAAEHYWRTGHEGQQITEAAEKGILTSCPGNVPWKCQ